MFYKRLILLLCIFALMSGCGTDRKSSSGNVVIDNGNATSIQLTGETTAADSNTTSGNQISAITIHSAVTLQQEERMPLYLSVTYADGSSRQIASGITFFSDNPQIASVDANGIVTAHTPGSTQIHAQYAGKEALIAVKVVPASTPLPKSLKIVLTDNRLETGERMHLLATVTLSDGTSTTPEAVAWQSQTPEICLVSEKGTVEALQPGNCRIEARYSQLQTTATITVIRQVGKVVYECPATQASEAAFRDTFTTESHADIDYDRTLIFAALSVEEIEALFNHARAADPTVNQPMVLPPQNIWDSYTASRKTLYLINAERCARGIRPLEGIDPTLRDSVTRPYAEFISTHEEIYLAHPHTADGKNPGERMAEAGIVLGKNSEYYGENIAMIGIATAKAQPIYEAEAKSVYAWAYQDRGEGYGHRKFIFHTGYNDDSGKVQSEGLIAAYTAEITYKDDDGFFWTKTFTVLDGFDPTPDWDDDLAHTTRLPLYKKLSP